MYKNNYDLNNLNKKTNFNILDDITILSFIAQIKNINDDKVQTNYIQKVIKAIADEIEKLHKENDIIMQQNEEIIKLLKGNNNGLKH